MDSGQKKAELRVALQVVVQLLRWTHDQGPA